MIDSSTIIILILLEILLTALAVVLIFLFIRRKSKNENELLEAEKRRSQQLSLLEETGRMIADSFNESEILHRAVHLIIQRFKYAEAAICVKTPDDMLEIAVISGTAHIGYEVGYRQKIGTGIIGHTAQIQKTYLSNNVGKDPYYFSTFEYNGSVICIPLWKAEKLFGVLYIESAKANAFDPLDVTTLETLATQISGSIYRASLYAETQENLQVLSIIQKISQTIATSLNTETIANYLVSALQEAFGYTHISIYTLEDDYLNIITEVGYQNKDMVYKKMHISQGVHGRAIRTKTVQFIENTAKDDVYLTADNSISSEICIPLIKEDTVIGTINVESSNENKLTKKDVSILTTIASPLAIAIDNARLHEQIKKMATTDAVTGLSNRHAFEENILAEIERAQRTNTKVSLIIFDIDFFKEYNDTYGHPAGDARLKEIASLIKNNLRKYDIAARYGGDEFAIILSNSTEQNAILFANRLLEAAKQGAPKTTNKNMAGYTLSMGIATFPIDALNANELVIAADNAALRAKHLGKNRIRLASDTQR
jgi:diguanylate cyclase (GGDEF)-like protein